MQEISQVYSWIIFDSLKKFQLTFLFQNFHSKATRINCLNNIYFVKLRFVCCFHCSLASLVTITHNLNIHILPSRILQDCMVKRDCGFICSLSLSLPHSTTHWWKPINFLTYFSIHSFTHEKKYQRSLHHLFMKKKFDACLPAYPWINDLIFSLLIFFATFFSLENK